MLYVNAQEQKPYGIRFAKTNNDPDTQYPYYVYLGNYINNLTRILNNGGYPL